MVVQAKRLLCRECGTALSIDGDSQGLCPDCLAKVAPQAPLRHSEDPEQTIQAADVLDTLIDARLLTSYEVPAEENHPAHHRIEVVHESLLSHWPRLVRWQMQDAEGAKLRDELRAQAQLWQEHDRSEDYLWTGTTFKEYELWRQRYPGGLTKTEDAFASAMVGLAARRSRRRRIAFGLALMIASAIALWMGVLWRQSEIARAESEVARQEAVAEARRAEAAKLLALAQLKRGEDPTEALAYTTASLELADTEEGRLLALRLLWEAPPALERGDLPEGGLYSTFSPDGTYLAVAGFGQEVRVYSAGGGPPLILSGHVSTTQGTNYARWASNELLVTGHWTEGRARVWSIPGGELVREIDMGGPAYFGMAGDHRLFAEVFGTDDQTGHDLYHLRSWQLPDGEAEDLGTVDWTALGKSWSFVDPTGERWVYPLGRNVYYRPLPARDGVADRLVSSHENDFSFAGVPIEPDRFWTEDSVTAELLLWDLSAPRATLLQAIPRPAGLEEGASVEPPDSSGRWLSSFTRWILLWDLDAWPGARPLRLRRSGAWPYSPSPEMHPNGTWMNAVTRGSSRLTFWPLTRPMPMVVEDFESFSYRPLAFSPDGKWLAGFWGAGRRQVRLWPVPGNSSREPRTLTLPIGQPWVRIEFDPHMRFLFAGGGPDDSIDLVPLDGSEPRRLEGLEYGSMSTAAAVSPSGRQVASAPGRQGPWKLRLWDVETGERRLFDLPESESTSQMGRARAVWTLAFVDESTLYSSGDGGIRRWDLESGSYETVLATAPDIGAWMELLGDGRTAIVGEIRLDDFPDRKFGLLRLVDLVTGEEEELTAFGEGTNTFVLDSSGEVIATSDNEGVIQVGKVSATNPHLLLGHEGAVQWLALSVDGKWVASAGEDKTLRLWPVPNLDKPPLHTLPIDDLIDKLHSLTNFRVLRDSESAQGWKVALNPFPGWEEVPEW